MIYDRPDATHRPAVRILAGVLLAAMLVLAFLGYPPPIHAQVKWQDPVSLPPVSGTNDTGRAAPAPLDVELDGTYPVSITPQPTLVWKNVPAGTGQVQFKVISLTAAINAKPIWQTTVRVGTDRVARAKVAAGILKQGRSYGWAAVSTSDGTKRVGPFSVTVDQQRASVQPTFTLGGVSVAEATGELVYTWQGPTASALTGQVGWTLTHRPTNTARPGLPAGWSLAVTGSTAWESLKLNADGSVTLVNNTGGSVSYTKSGANQWKPAVGRFATAGQSTMLSQNADGTFSATDGNRGVTVFSQPTVNMNGYPTKVWGLDAPTIQQSWISGRIATLTDPVTQNTTGFFYGGDTGCGATTDSGFQAAPKGYLCGVLDWGGNLTLFEYVTTTAGPQIGRIVSGLGMGVNAGVEDIGWDDSGRIVETRAPFTTRVIAAGAVPGLGTDDDRAKTQVTYNALGRVATITAPEGLIAQETQPAVRTHRAQVAITYAPFSVTGTSDGAPIGILEQTWTDPLSMQQTKTRDRQGNTFVNEYDANGFLIRTTDQQTNTITESQYDAQGRPTEQLGPTRGTVTSPTAPRTTTQYDQDVNGNPWTGLGVRYWDNSGFNDAPKGGTTGPIMPGASAPIAGLSTNWSTPPVATASGDWAARMTGLYVAPADGAYVFQNTTTAQMWVNGSICSPTCNVSLKKDSAVSLQLDVVATAGATVGINALVTPPGGQRTPIPTSQLRPNYGLATSSTVREHQAGGGTRELVTRMVYDSVTTALLETIAPSGAKQTRTYEPYDPAKGQWGRSTSVTDASGKTTVAGFAAATAVGVDCQGTQLAQEGAQQTLALAGGTTISQVVAPGGGAVKTTDGTTTTCGSALAEGTGTASTTTGVGAAVTTTTSSYVQGNPLVVSSSTTSQGVTETMISRLDSNGTAWEMTDAFGTKTITQSDPFSGLTTRQTETTAKGETRTADYTYATNDEIATVTVNGRLLLTNEYGADGRFLRTVLANGAVQTVELDANNRGKKIETTFADGTVVSETAVHSPTGRILTRTLSGPTGTSTYAYTYNADGRLTHTTLTGTIPTTATAWHSQYDGPAGMNGNRASKTTTHADGTQRTTAFTYGEDNRPLTASEGPAKGTISYDAARRATKIGGVDLAYDATGMLLSAAQGDRSYTFTDGGLTSTLTRTLADGATSTVSVSSSGNDLMLGPDRTIEAQVVTLASGITVVLDKTGAPARWLYEDMLGSTTWRSVGNAAPARTHLYAPGGEPISVQRGTTPATPLDLIVNSLGWMSGRGATTLRLSTTLMMIGARVYTPDVGRWLQPDPDVNASFNAYEYAIGDPINQSDASGNASQGWLWGLVASVVVGALIGTFTFGIGPMVTGAMSLAQIAVQIAMGAVAGAISSAVGDVVTQSVDKGWANIDWSAVGVAAGLGAGGGAVASGVFAVALKALPAAIVARRLAAATPQEFAATQTAWGRVKEVGKFRQRLNFMGERQRELLAVQGETSTLGNTMFSSKGVFTRAGWAKAFGNVQQESIAFDDLFSSTVSQAGGRSAMITGPVGNNSARITQQNLSIVSSIDSSDSALQQVLRVKNVPQGEYGMAVRNSIKAVEMESLYPPAQLRFSAGSSTSSDLGGNVYTGEGVLYDFMLKQLQNNGEKVKNFGF